MSISFDDGINLAVFILYTCLYLRASYFKDTSYHSNHLGPATFSWKDPVKVFVVQVNQTCKRILVEIYLKSVSL